MHIIPTVLPENAPNKEVTFVVIDLGKFDLRKDPDNHNAFFLKGKETGSEQFDLYVERFSKNLSVQVIDRAFIQPAFTENTISGVKGSYELDSSLSFTAKGSGLDNQEPLWEDWRWVPGPLGNRQTECGFYSGNLQLRGGSAGFSERTFGWKS